MKFWRSKYVRWRNRKYFDKFGVKTRFFTFTPTLSLSLPRTLSLLRFSLPDSLFLSLRFSQFRQREGPAPVPFDSSRSPDHNPPHFPAGNLESRRQFRLVQTGFFTALCRRLRRPIPVN
ncbi:unnamed protein product [Prunus armeniaca]